MKKLLIVALALCLACQALAQQAAESDHGEVFAEVDAIVAQLAEITGWEMKQKVPRDVIGREALKDFLEERVGEEIKPEELRIEALLLAKFGFVPADFDLKDTMIELYTEQAAAFYDFHKQRLFLLESSDDAMQETALVHELAHALADQHLPLRKYLDDADKNDDGALARMAVMEGQATWLMSEFMVRRMGQSLVDSPEMVDLMARMIGGASTQFPVFSSAPLYIRESLMFPYTSGMKFQQKLVEEFGPDGFARPFENAPETTREILHPEVYIAREKALAPALPKIRNQKQYEPLAEGTIGEFDFAVLFQQYASENIVRAIAPGWRGGEYAFLEHKKKKDTVLLLSTAWETDDIAAAFAREYRRVLEKKWESFDVSAESETEVRGTGDDGHFVIHITGTTVHVAEGLRFPSQIRRWPQP